MSHTSNQDDYLRPDKGIRIRFQETSIVKSFREPVHSDRPDRRDERFSNELDAYRCFKFMNWPYAPSLLDYDEQERWIEIERIVGMSVHEHLMEDLPFNVSDTVNQILTIHQSLIEHRINAHGATPKDILLDTQGRTWLIDFEETTLNHRVPNHLLYSLLWNLNARWKQSYKHSIQKIDVRTALQAAIQRDLLTSPSHVLPFLKTFLYYKKREIHCLIRNKPY
jgi:predicted Ser/Thr protein kinase